MRSRRTQTCSDTQERRNRPAAYLADGDKVDVLEWRGHARARARRTHIGKERKQLAEGLVSAGEAASAQLYVRVAVGGLESNMKSMRFVWVYGESRDPPPNTLGW